MSAITLNRMCILLVGAVLLVMVSGCSSLEPTPIRYGEDGCAYCMMTIVEQAFGTQLLNTRGKPFKFDSIECLAAYTRRGDIPTGDIGGLWVTDHRNPGTWVPAEQAIYVHTDHARSPMGMGLFAFADADPAAEFARTNDGRTVAWEDVLLTVEEAWLSE